jgi:WD40 repeat protein
VNVIVTWGDANDTNVQTFTIPAGSFLASKKGHLYKCNKIDVDPCDAADVNDGVVTAQIDLDKCTFKVWIRNANDLFAERHYNTVFNISFDTPNGVFNEEDDYTLP